MRLHQLIQLVFFCSFSLFANSRAEIKIHFQFDLIHRKNLDFWLMIWWFCWSLSIEMIFLFAPHRLNRSQKLKLKCPKKWMISQTDLIDLHLKMFHFMLFVRSTNQLMVETMRFITNEWFRFPLSDKLQFDNNRKTICNAKTNRKKLLFKWSSDRDERDENKNIENISIFRAFRTKKKAKRKIIFQRNENYFFIYSKTGYF